MFQKPSIDNAMKFFVKGAAELRQVQENSMSAAQEKNQESERLAAEATAERAVADRAARIADRLDELLA